MVKCKVLKSQSNVQLKGCLEVSIAAAFGAQHYLNGSYKYNDMRKVGIEAMVLAITWSDQRVSVSMSSFIWFEIEKPFQISWL